MSNIVKECFVTARDGVKLYTVIQLPCEQGTFPTIIIRNPYAPDKIDFEALANENTHGYAIVSQHCRGTAKSEGVCIPYLNERNDGLDLLDWVRQQSFYNGELFLLGGSYCSSVHFSYINTNQPDIKAAVLKVQDTERYNILYRNGFYKTGLHGKWAVSMYKRNMNIRREFTEETYRTLPLAGITNHIFGESVYALEEEFMHPDPKDNFWQTPLGGSDYSDALLKCDVPVLLTTGFYDIYTEGIFDMWKKLPADRRKDCALIVSPFAHAWDPPKAAEESEVPDFENARVSEICPDFHYMWFDHFRKGTDLKFIERGKIKYYTLFENKWHTVEDLNNAPEKIELFLASDRSLNKNAGVCCDITYTYNPYNPAAFKGGLCNNFGGMQIQDAPDSRYDIISFISEPFEDDFICEGKGKVRLSVKSTAPDTCFYVRLSLIKNGKTLGMRDDITSLCRLEKDYTPETERVLDFTFGDHSFKIEKGDALRLDVSSSCVPYFQVHTNKKGLLALHDKADICRNTIVAGKSSLQIFCKKS